MESLEAQTGLVFLTYRAVTAVDRFVQTRVAANPEVDFLAPDGVRHSAWTIRDPESVGWIESQFAKVPFLYVADGHHRSAAAARMFQARRGAGNSPRFLTVIFPHNQMQILPYNRVLKDLHGLTPASLIARLDEVFEVLPGTGATPTRKHDVCLFLDGGWRTLRFRSALTQNATSIEALDVSLLQTHVLAPVFGIDDPRTSQRISFVGGIRGTAELEKRVHTGEGACAFSLFPTGIEDLMTIADAGGIMPPKSTWFEPKLRDGMFCHRL
jgi:uncharacterized protein (DUF1015 family)